MDLTGAISAASVGFELPVNTFSLSDLIARTGFGAAILLHARDQSIAAAISNDSGCVPQISPGKLFPAQMRARLLSHPDWTRRRRTNQRHSRLTSPASPP